MCLILNCLIFKDGEWEFSPLRETKQYQSYIAEAYAKVAEYIIESSRP